MTKSTGAVTTVGVHEAKTNLSRLLRMVESGTEVHITRASQPIARLVPISSSTRELGFAAGTFEVPDDFDETDPDLVESFYA